MLKKVAYMLLLALLIAAVPLHHAAAEEVTIRIAHWLGDPIHGSGLERLMNEVEEEVAKYGIRVETVINGTSASRRIWSPTPSSISAASCRSYGISSPIWAEQSCFP